MGEPHGPEILLEDDACIRRLSRRLLRDAHEADDAAQQTWLAAIERRQSLHARPRAWLATVLRNFARRALRDRERRLRRELIAARPERVPSASEIAEREAARRSVVEAVLALEPPYREAILLRFYENCSPRVAARRLGMPVETFRTHVKRALAMLRATLDREHGDRRRWYLALLPVAAVPPRWSAMRPLASALEPGGPLVSVMLQTAVVLVLAVGGWLLVRSNGAPEAGPGKTSVAATLGDAAPAPATDLDRTPATQPLRGGDEREEIGGGGTVIVQARFHDGTPAATVGIELIEWAFSNIHLHRRYALADADGLCRFENVTAGKAYVLNGRDPGGTEWIDVAPGSEQEVDLELRDLPWDLAGRVVDENGAPVTGADIWFQGDYIYPLGYGQVVTRSADDGTFTLREVTKLSRVSARAAGHAPSLGVLMEPRLPEDGTTISVTLTLGGPASRIEGRVLTLGGDAVPGARVVIDGNHCNADYDLLNPPVLLFTDADGRFATENAGIGTNDISASADGFATALGSVEARAGATTSIDLVLGAGAALHGKLSTPSGEPVPGGYVTLTHMQAPEELWTTSDAGGAFSFEHFAPGKIWLQTGDQEARLDARDGEVLEWNVVLPERAPISGRVLDEHDAPLAGHAVVAMLRGSSQGQHARTDVDGRFRIEGLAPGRYVVGVLAEARLAAEVLASVKNVDAGATDVLIRVTDASRPSARVSGVVRLADGSVPRAGSRVTAPLPGGLPDRSTAIDAHTGAFDLGLLAPGTYELKATVPGLGERSLGAVTLSRDQRLDLGTITLTRAADTRR
jgi:RNA polymerase sigma factor (sigma-70 family)